MRIALVTLGTRGDVAPYIPVAKALRARGHEVVFGTHAEFEPMVRAAGFELRPIRGGFRELTSTELGKKWLSSADRPFEYARWAEKLLLPLAQPWLDDADAALEGCDAVAFYMIAVHALVGAERRGIPAVCLAPWPAYATRELPPVVMPSLEILPRFLLPTAWSLSLRVLFGGYGPTFRAHRARVGLPPDPAPSPLHSIAARDVPVVQLFSEHVIARPSDWPAHVDVAGFSFDTTEGYEPPEALARFLAAKDDRPLVYAGFGSMTGHSPVELARIAVGAARRANVRLVYATGWGGGVQLDGDDVFVIDELPHDWLFPRVDAVVHHGGAGTFAEGLRAGKPTVILAFFADQPFWGRVNARLGAGPPHLTRKGLTEARLAGAIRRATSEGRYRESASAIAAKLAREDGAARAAELVERHLEAAREGRRRHPRAPE